MISDKVIYAQQHLSGRWYVWSGGKGLEEMPSDALSYNTEGDALIAAHNMWDDEPQHEGVWRLPPQQPPPVKGWLIVRQGSDGTMLCRDKVYSDIGAAKGEVAVSPYRERIIKIQQVEPTLFI